ncbi:cellulase family glycosylhydrolase [Salmonirosea aquatica]|uniref:Cellulase family glycosylhydrolase n=1 Tax=Salmonirosea aquatica TaxID=2654236 RepID=A0A7C9BE43_9BACT|nr:cellulase family glycosylhydrolase [Cytophagaceae bacterium SJW1-29]
MKTLQVYFVLLLLATCGLLACKNTDSGTSPAPVIPGVPPVTESADFSVNGSTIVDKTGAEFIAKGINVNGPGWPWTRQTIPDINLIVDTWKFNTIRLNCWVQNPPYNNPNNSDLDAIVKSFTDKKVVVILEDHSFTGTYPNTDQLNTAVSWWTAQALKYKTNAYVWFNLINEPGSSGSGSVPASWLTVHETIIKAIRNAGADNIIVCDEHGYGQANGFAATENSAALTYGEMLTSKYRNLVFSLHLYDLWVYGKSRLDNYVNSVKAKKLALLIGEYGVGSTDVTAEVASSVMQVGIPQKIGRIGWHWAGIDTYKLANTGDGGGFAIDNTTGAKPTNLGFGGNLIWLDNHTQLQGTDVALTPPAVLLSNANFDGGTLVNNSANIAGWVNFGTAQLDNTPTNVKEGNYSVKVKQGAAGGLGQVIYLQPGATYKITAWGKNSQTVSVATIVALKYTTTAGGTETQVGSLNFTEVGFQEKSAIFTLPASITSMFLVIYKSDTASDFWCDDIRITKQ